MGLKLKIIPDMAQLKKALSNLKVGVGGKASPQVGTKKDNSGESKKILSSLSGIGKLLGLVAAGTVIISAIMKFVEPIFKLFGIILTLLFLPLIPLLKPVLLALAGLAKKLGAIGQSFLKGDIGLSEFIIQAVTELTNTLIEITPIILEGIMQVMNALVTALPIILPILIDGFMQIVTGIIDFLPDFLDAFLGIIDAIIESGFIEKVIQAFVDLINLLIDSGILQKIIDAFIKIIFGIITLITQLVPPLIEAFVAVVNALIPFTAEIVAALIPVFVILIKALFFAVIEIIKSAGLSLLNLGSSKSSADFKSKQDKTFGRNVKSGQDFILRPNGDMIKADPRDTLIATKTPESLVNGGGGSIIININNPSVRNDQDIRKLANEVSRVLAQQGSRR